MELLGVMLEMPELVRGAYTNFWESKLYPNAQRSTLTKTNTSLQSGEMNDDRLG